MPESFNLLEHRDDFPGWAFMVALSEFKLARRGSGEESHQFWTERGDRGGPVEIELKINGHETSFLKILERMREENERKIKLQAAEMVRERLQQIDGTIHEWLREKSDELKNDVAAMFPELDVLGERE